MVRRTTIALVGALLVVATLAGGVVMGDAGNSAEQKNATDRTITVSATGTAETNPDKAVVRVAVEHTADNASEAREAVAENVSEVRSALADIGIGEDQVRTDDYDIYRHERRQPTRGGEGEAEVVYRASHSLSIELSEVDRSGEVIDVAVANGATSVRNVQFTLSDETREELKQQALENAMDGADAKAQTIASSAELTLGQVRTVDAQDRHRPVRAVETAAGYSAGADTDISAGPVTVSTSVTVTYDAEA